MAVPVDIFVTDESVVPVEMPGVEVGIFNSTTGALVAQATSDVDGKASFMLPGAASPGTTYEVRLFKLGVNFHGLNSIQVIEPAVTTNKFDVTGADGNLLPVSGSSTLCRCSGLFVGLDGSPVANCVIRITSDADMAEQSPKIFNGAMISAGAKEIRTDANGRVSVDLVRTAKYWVTFAGNDDDVWPIVVPDESSVSLVELIHPRPVQWEWDQTDAPLDAITVAVGETKTVAVSILLSNYQESTEITKYFTLDTDPGTFAEVTIGPGYVSIRGLAAGTDVTTPSVRDDLYPIRFPTQPPVVTDLTITVTP